MRMRITAGVVAAALALIGASYVADWLQHRSVVGVVSGTDDDHDSGIGVATRDFDEADLQKVKTIEDFERLTGLRIETAGPSPSAWRR